MHAAANSISARGREQSHALAKDGRHATAEWVRTLCDEIDRLQARHGQFAGMIKSGMDRLADNVTGEGVAVIKPDERRMSCQKCGTIVTAPRDTPMWMSIQHCTNCYPPEVAARRHKTWVRRTLLGLRRFLIDRLR